jgi:hypothetical protein
MGKRGTGGVWSMGSGMSKRKKIKRCVGKLGRIDKGGG